MHLLISVILSVMGSCVVRAAGFICIVYRDIVIALALKVLSNYKLYLMSSYYIEGPLKVEAFIK